jgi:hypothetical protein
LQVVDFVMDSIYSFNGEPQAQAKLGNSGDGAPLRD